MTDTAASPAVGARQDRPAVGAYGLAIDVLGVDDPPGLLTVPSSVTSPERITVEHVINADHEPIETPHLGPDEMHYPFFLGGRLDMVREERRAVVTTHSALSPADLVHPYLSPIGGMWARWLGREPFHCSAAVLGGKVWGLLGPREAGKSTLVAWLATHGIPIMTDDLLVVDASDGQPVAHAGPRSVDLREPTAKLLTDHLGDAVSLTQVRERERWRLPVADVRWSLPMGGWFILGQSEEIALTKVGPAERLSVLADHRMVRLEVQDAVHWMDLARLPTFHLTRPKTWESLPNVVEAMHVAADG